MPRVVKGYKETAKTSIIKAAMEVFSSKGYHKATMDDVARKLGVSKAALYQYFKGKDELLREIQSTSRQQIWEDFDRAFENRTVEEGAGILFDAIFGRSLAGSSVSFDMFSLAASDEKLRRVLREDHDGDLKLIEAFIEKQAEKRKIRLKMDKRTVSRLLTGISFEVLLELMLGYDKTTVKKTWVDAITTILQG